MTCGGCRGPISAPAPPFKRRLVAGVPAPLLHAYWALHRRAFAPSGGQALDPRRLRALRGEFPGLTLDGMAVVCCYFNPCGYRSRLTNYKTFRRELELSGLPVLTVELAVGEAAFELDAEAGEMLRIRTPHAMWQKERLLNLGIQELLRRGYRKIVWLDADVVFADREAWPWMVAAELERSSLCQVFGQVLVEQGPDQPALPGISSTRYLRATKQMLQQGRRLPSIRHPLGLPPGRSGFGWAARAEVLRAVPLYDASVIGGGDTLIYAGSYSADTERRRQAHQLLETSLPPCASCGRLSAAPRFVEHYLAWAARWADAVEGRVGFAGQAISTLYHGDRIHRRYVERRDILLRHEFDPSTDLELDASGAWRWGSSKADLHRDVMSYLFDRREDS